MPETTLTKSDGFAVLSTKLDDCAETIKRELSEVHRLFLELVPRCKTIGNQLNTAKGFHGNDTAGFYSWCETNFGIKQRQVRTYLAFAGKIDRIEAEAKSQSIELTSMEQGLALLAPPKEVADINSDDFRLTHMVSAVARARGAMTRAQEAIFDLVGANAIDRRHLAAFEAMQLVLDTWSSTKQTAAGTFIPSTAGAPKLDLAVDRPQEEWSEVDIIPAEVDITPENAEPEDLEDMAWSQSDDDLARLEKAKLPVGEKITKWTLAQLEEGKALCDGNQSRLAKALGTSSANVSVNLKRKRAKQAAEDYPAKLRAENAAKQKAPEPAVA